ncbi:MAG TPA: VOC family protein [Vicinamibacteria bacterium]|nr:VOC family protein [Vicinamibacteria bacterium]
MRTHMVWFEILGQHSDNLHGFYAELLGWKFDARHPLPPGDGARSGERNGLARSSSRVRSTPPWWVTFYTRVADLDSTIGKARALGSRVLVPPTRHGDTVIAVVSDPEGHPIGLCT